MSSDEFKDLCREAWKTEECSYLYIHGSKKKSEGKYCLFNESKNTSIECNPETGAS